MTDETPMTDTERATAYEAEAARLLDKITHRGYWSGEISPEADRFVELIVQAAVLRMAAVASMTDARTRAAYLQNDPHGLLPHTGTESV